LGPRVRVLLQLRHERPDALLVATGPPFTARCVQVVQLATYYKIPTIYAQRQFVEIGGLITYGASLTDAYRRVGCSSRRSFAAVHESGPGTEGELRPSGNCGRNRRNFCRSSQAGRRRSM
jgi:hypothetical protein